jgi:small basic protein (TIGR04137 family)
MSMDKGLKPRNALARHRNVLTRDERIAALTKLDHFQEGQSILGLPKVANRKIIVKKEKVEKAAEGVTAEGAVPAAGAAAPAAEAAKTAAKPAAKPAAKK